MAQAVNGDLHLALPKLDEIDSPRLRQHVRLVLAIESYRRGSATVGSEMLSQLQSDGIDEYTAYHLAIGVTNRVPWLCYPFTDY